jgi:hypothetical protein
MLKVISKSMLETEKKNGHDCHVFAFYKIKVCAILIFIYIYTNVLCYIDEATQDFFYNPTLTIL